MRLKDYLKEKNIKPYHFCLATGIDKAVLSRFLNGKAGVSTETALKIIEQTSGMVSLKDIVNVETKSGSAE
jgi:plasmid maintenance system antidote protein VapI